MKDTFTIGGAFKEARSIVHPKFWKIVGQYAAILGTFMLCNILAGNNTLLGIVISAIFAFASAVFALGYAKRGQFEFSDLAKAFTFQAFAYFFLAYLVSKLIVILGILLLVIPGIMLAVWLCFVNFVAVEGEMSPWKACKESARLTRGLRWKLLGFFIVALLFNILGLAALVVGLLYTLPVTAIALGVIYRQVYEVKDFVPNIVEVIEVDVIEVPVEETAEVV